MKTIKLDHITKIEGHAKLTVKVENGKVSKVDISVFESARFFESLIKGRRFDEVPYLTSRICGVCSPAHLMASILAIEDAFKIEVSEQVKLLRELLVLGGIIQSHAVHLFFLVLPDYFGYGSAIDMSKGKPELISLGLKTKSIGTTITTAIGGRDYHPITAEVGGFSRIPTRRELDELLSKLINARDDFVKAAELFFKLDYPVLIRNVHYFALEKSNHYPIIEGKVSCFGTYCIENRDYLTYFREQTKRGSAAKFVLYQGKPFYVGARARMNLNYEFLSKGAQQYYVKSDNPYMNNIAQATEMLHFIDRSIEIIKSLKLEPEAIPKIKPRAGRGVSATEAPRGLLFHDYEFDRRGYLKRANIITPTVLNLKSMEEDIKELLSKILYEPKEKIINEIEKLVRAYDPCISCSAHFLEVDFQES